MFSPSTNKFEAVNRISNLTNAGPQELGPGSKERKSVLINLAIGLGITFSHEFTKQELAAHLAKRLGRPWLSEYESVGQTITLKGLNLLLEAALEAIEERVDQSPISTGDAFKDELHAIATVVKQNTPLVMDGRRCVQEMRDLKYSNWKQTEWQGFYFEMRAGQALRDQLGGSSLKMFNTSFDYARNFIWDLKAHSSENRAGTKTPTCILNDSRAFEKAVQETGLGFIVLSGKPTYDIDFTKWHKAFRGGNENESVRTLKSQFVAESLDIFFVPDSHRLELAAARKELTVQAQGKNSNSKGRPPKYHLNLKKALGSDLQVYSHSFM